MRTASNELHSGYDSVYLGSGGASAKIISISGLPPKARKSGLKFKAFCHICAREMIEAN